MRVLLVPAPTITASLDRISGALRAAGLNVTIGDFERSVAGSFQIVAGPGTMPCDQAWLAAQPDLIGLVSIGVGCEGFDRAAAETRSISVETGNPRDGASAMAGATIMLMMALCHDLPAAQTALVEGRRRDLDRARAIETCVVGIIGYGAIGGEVVRRLRAWEVPVLISSPSLPHGPRTDGSESAPLQSLLERSDIVSLHASLGTATRHMIDRNRIAAMKRGAMLVNTARGGLIDERALIDALHSGRLAGAALDCFEIEPLPANSPLRTAPNVILTPHQIGHTAAGSEAVIERFIANILHIAQSYRGRATWDN
ncbi:hypothetical protein BH09PSE4_BH09PSE4_04690 [soil metagenome]